MPEPTHEIIAAMPEQTGTSAVIDDVEVFAASDQWPTADLSDFDDEHWADQ
jgi:hypothetical protein